MAKGLILSAVTLVFMLVAIEMAGRVFPGLLPYRIGQDFVSCSGLRERLKPEKNFGRLEYAGHRYFNRRSKLDPWFAVEINQFGFRDTENSGANGAIVLGDSFSFGVHASQGQTYPDFLDKMFPEISFYNFGIDGAGTAQEYLVYKNISDQISHDLVILTMFNNDIRDNLHKGKHDQAWRPKFSLTEGRLEYFPPSENDISLNPDENIFPEVKDAFRYSKTLRNVLSNSFIVNAIYYRFMPLVENLFDKNFVQEEQQKGVALTIEIVKSLYREVSNRGASFVIVYIPEWISERGTGVLGSDEALLSELYKLSDKASGMYVFDAKPVLMANPEDYYGKVDKHLSARGYYVLAKAVGKFLVSSGVVLQDVGNIKFREIDVKPYCNNFSQYTGF